jgi:hypothetical protein
MTTFGYAQNNLSDADNNGSLDILEYEKNNQKAISDGNKNNIAMNKQMLDKQKLAQQQTEHKDKLYQNALKMRNEKELALLKIKQAKVQGDKSK